MAPGPVRTGAEILLHTGIGSLDRPARSELLHRLIYPGPLPVHCRNYYIIRRHETGAVQMKRGTSREVGHALMLQPP